MKANLCRLRNSKSKAKLQPTTPTKAIYQRLQRPTSAAFALQGQSSTTPPSYSQGNSQAPLRSEVHFVFTTRGSILRSRRQAPHNQVTGPPDPEANLCRLPDCPCPNPPADLIALNSGEAVIIIRQELGDHHRHGAPLFAPIPSWPFRLYQPTLRCLHTMEPRYKGITTPRTSHGLPC